MKVSIIIPVYNVSAYIERCVKSVMSQTYSGDIECILVNDATPDDSIAIAEHLIADYNGPFQFLILSHDHNRGQSAARNTGIDVFYFSKSMIYTTFSNIFTCFNTYNSCKFTH